MNNFHAVSTHTFEELADFFETSWPEADVDLLDETLTVSLQNDLHYLINKHEVTQQLWLASPFTGAHHFYLKNGQWWCTRTNLNLEELLRQERDTYAT
ncbi:MAG: iron donor protein CyaY [Alphaproteobacteria bacterium]|nr:iron donor protein CyaY [Alphaproteobacteria bacterium]